VDYTVLPVSRSLFKRDKAPFGEKRRFTSGIHDVVIDTDQSKQTKSKTGG